jgi:hypothetical protein
MTDRDKTKIRNMRKDGRGYAEIADSLGLSKNTVKSFCHPAVPDGVLRASGTRLAPTEPEARPRGHRHHDEHLHALRP